MTRSIEIKGLKETRTALYSFGRKFGDKVVRKATRVGAKVIQSEARSLAPRDKGRLRKNIVIKNSKLFNGRRNRQIGVFLTIRSKGKASNPLNSYYGRFLEDGWNVKGTAISGPRPTGSSRKTNRGKRNITGRKFIDRAYNRRKALAARKIGKALIAGAEVLKRREGFR